MYQTLTILHNMIRWGVLFFVLLAIFRSVTGYRRQTGFTRSDNLIRHWSATFAHIQLMIGMLLYFESPVTRYFWANRTSGANSDMLFFSLIHSGLMITAVVLLTIGSAMAKRKTTDSEKFKTIFTWFSIALVVILIAIPWPFSPFAQRPYFR